MFNRQLIKKEDGSFEWELIKDRDPNKHFGHFSAPGGPSRQREDVGPSRMPEVPMESFPGTLERVYELEQRASRGEHLWHPDDRRTLHGFKGDFHEQSIFGAGPKKYR